MTEQDDTATLFQKWQFKEICDAEDEAWRDCELMPRYRVKATNKPAEEYDKPDEFAYVARIRYSCLTPVIYTTVDAALFFPTLDKALEAATFANSCFPERKHEPEEIKGASA